MGGAREVYFESVLIGNADAVDSRIEWAWKSPVRVDFRL